MKRLIIALILLLIIIVILVVGNMCVNTSAEQTVKVLDQSYKEFESKNFDSALHYAEKLEQLWESQKNKLSIFVNNAILEDIGVCIAKIKSCTKYRNNDFYSECDTLYVLLKNMQDEEKFPFLGVF